MKKFLPSALLALGLAASLHAAPPPANYITWHGFDTVDSTLDVLNTGLFVAAEGGRTVSTTINGVTFDARNTSNQITFGGSWSGSPGFGLASPTGDAAFDALLKDGYYTAGSGAPETITLSGLTIGTQYRVQVFVGTWDIDFPTRIQDGTSYIDMQNSDDVATTVYGLFTAESATETFDFRSSVGNQHAIISAISLYAIPEPSTYAAIAGALALGLAFHRRRPQTA